MKKEEKYLPSEIEKKWQKIWDEKRVYQPDLKNAGKPYYNLMMFPYPSAEGLHVGNMYAFTGADINGRYKRMAGYDVFEPIGLDGFGIHSENYAIKIGKHPAEQAQISQKNFYRQLRAIGNGFAWKNTLETYDPGYYRWTQWIFTQMYKAGLAYRKKSPVNFCPSCKTVLADEQVIDGHCERCKTLVTKKSMEQWYFRITKYADRLLDNLQKLQWTQKVKLGQKNWIGKKEGINITYSVVDSSGQPITRCHLVSEQQDDPVTITVFTTRPDTNFGATFIVLAPEHPFVALLPKTLKQPKLLKDIEDYVAKAQKKSEADRIAEGRKKTGVFTGFYALNQLNGYKMPVWISDFALMSVGTGAIVGVPASDMRDFEFASEFKIPIKRVIVGEDGEKGEITKREQVCEEGIVINSEFLNGLKREEAIPKMMDYLEQKGWGKRVTTYKLRDWCVSRQRYWGAPIPMIDCPKCGWVPVPDDQLPVLLPANVTDWKPEGTGKGPLAKISSFVNVKCPKCGGKAQRETDVCDTFLDSSWYHMRYPSVGQSSVSSHQLSDIGQPKTENRKPKTENRNLPWNPAITRKWLPVTQYIGGAEHTVLHLLYARFVAMVFKDLRMIDFEEPYTRFYAHGLIIAEGAKMSKSRGNVVIPDAYIVKYGADTLRTYLMFLGPFDNGGDFRDTGIAGMYRFLSRVWRLVTESLSPKSLKLLKSLKQEDQINRIMHHTIKEVSVDMENFRYNTAIAHIMEYVNALTDNPQLITHNHIKSLLLMLAPFAPHMTEELWEKVSHLDLTTGDAREGSHTEMYRSMGYSSGRTRKLKSIHLSPWPSFDPKYLIEDEVTIIVQVNGKTRDTIKVRTENASDGGEATTLTPPRWKNQEIVGKIAKKSEKTQKYLEGKTIRKTIFVPGKLINFVV